MVLTCGRNVRSQEARGFRRFDACGEQLGVNGVQEHVVHGWHVVLLVVSGVLCCGQGRGAGMVPTRERNARSEEAPGFGAVDGRAVGLCMWV
jgi:hypothetical protein